MAIPRIDQALVDRGLAGSLEEARLMVLEGKVYLGAGKVSKPSDKVKQGLALTVRQPGMRYVSRGALKLEKALKAFGVEVGGRVCLDVGASTGGFTQVLLEAGASKVYAVDVGFGLLDWRLRQDPRVAVMEKTNARSLTPDLFSPAPSLGATDVSFISLRAVLPRAFAVLAGENRRFVALVKPQFEAPKEQVSPGGVVRDRQVHLDTLAYVAGEVEKLGWVCQGVDFSPITGAQGNIEFLMDLKPGDTAGPAMTGTDFRRAVEAAWRAHPQNPGQPQDRPGE